MIIKSNLLANRKVSVFILLLLLLFFLSMVRVTHAEPVDSLYVEDVNLIKGELESIKVYSLTRLSLEDPSIADIVKAEPDELLVIGKKVGQTPLFIWDENGKRILMIHVFQEDLDRLKARIEKLLASAKINEVDLSINESEGKIVLTGFMPEYKQENFLKIISPFSANLINLVNKKEQRDLIQVDAEIIEIKATLTKKLGLNWTSLDADSGISISFPETLPETTGMTGGDAWDLLNIGDFNRNTAFETTFNALVTEGNAKIISKPKLVVLNGEEASFTVGGQYPITTTTVNGETTSTSTDFKDYGVDMQITPTIVDNKIEITLSVDVTDIDSSVVTESGETAFSTTNIETKLYLEDRQLIIMAGFIKKNESETTNRVPYISKIPIVGKLFTYKESPANSNTELMLSLRPTILSRDSIDTEDTKTNVQDKPEEGNNSFANMEDVNFSEDEMVPTDKPIPANMQEYVKDVQKQIASLIKYPEEARASGWEGTVKIGLNILKDGTLYYTMLKDSSGNDVIDKDALRTARAAAPFSPFPAGSTKEKISIVIPISYSLN